MERCLTWEKYTQRLHAGIADIWLGDSRFLLRNFFLSKREITDLSGSGSYGFDGDAGSGSYGFDGDAEIVRPFYFSFGTH